MHNARMVAGILDVTSGQYVGMTNSRSQFESHSRCHRPRILRTVIRGSQQGQRPSLATGVERCSQLARVGRAEMDRGGVDGVPGAALCMGGDLCNGGVGENGRANFQLMPTPQG